MRTLVPVAILACLMALASCAGTDCEHFAETICKQHMQEETTYCGSDGEEYQSLCYYWTASCEKNLTMIGTGPNCAQYSTQPPTVSSTTIPPITAFDHALFNSIIHGIDDRIILSRVKGIHADSAKPIYTKQDHSNKIYLRNTNCWAYGLDLTCMSPWNSEHGVRKAGTLISPRHVVWARHYNIPINTTIRFIDAANNVVDRKIINYKLVDHHSHDSFYGKDIVVGLLDRDVPFTISFARLMPRNLATFRVTPNDHLPALSTDFEEKALVDDLNFYDNNFVSLREPSSHSIRHAYYESKIVGDSGNPTFFVINNQLVLLMVFTTGGAGGGTSIVHYYDEINRLMTELGGGYQLTEVNLGGFLHPGEIIPNIIG